MIRAVLKNGRIQPLDPLPTDWTEGLELRIEAGASPDDPELVERWSRELEQLGGARYELGEREELEAMLKEADEQAKALVRRQMGLQP